jgi:hypothetical protein
MRMAYHVQSLDKDAGEALVPDDPQHCALLLPVLAYHHLCTVACWYKCVLAQVHVDTTV